MSKSNTRNSSPNGDADARQPTEAEPGNDSIGDRVAPPSNASVLLLAGGFLAAMFIVVAAEFVRHHIS